MESKANNQQQKEFKLEDLQEVPADIVKKNIEDKTNYSLGNPKGKFVIIEFFGHQCGWSKLTNKAMEEALIELGKSLKLDTKKLKADANGEKLKLNWKAIKNLQKL